MRPLLFTALPLLLASCASELKPSPNNTRKFPQLPQTWKEAGRGQSGKISSGWLNEFQSPRMTTLVLEAVKNNPSIRAAEDRLQASWALTSVSDADLGPQLSGSSSSSRQRSGNGSSTRSLRSSHSIGASLSWELDLWGQLKDRSSADKADFRAEEHQLRNARLSLAANTAKAWCHLITAEQQLQLAKKTLHSFQKNKSIVERNYKAGVPGTSSLAVQLSRTNVSSAQSTLRNRQLQRNNAARALEVLLGRYPSAAIKSSQTLPRIRRSIPTGIPAQLLSRRPDIAAAELAIYASEKRADASRKSLLPGVRFSSSLSNGGSSLSDIFNAHNLVSSAAASLSQTFYDGGQLNANAKAAMKRHHAALHGYANIVLRASREIEQAIATDKALREQEQFLIEQTKSSTLAEAQAERDYSEGIEGVGILEVLESQRRANNARSSLINIRNQRLQNRIDLHLALGGDFQTNT